jgi:two-component system nitrogen regulation sensor histidine kinase NtrY
MTIAVTPEPRPQPDWLQRNLFWASRRSWLSYALVGSALAAAVTTYLIQTGSTPIDATPAVRSYLIVIDALLLVTLMALVGLRLWQVWSARRSGGAGARLHSRLVTIFSAIAVIPVVLQAVAAGITINLAMEAWFNTPVRSVVDTASAVTNEYFDEHTEKLRKEISFAAANLNERTALDFATMRFQKYVEAIADRLNADVKVFNRRGQEIAAAGGGLASRVEQPTEEDFKRAAEGSETFVRTDEDKSQLRAMTKLGVQEEQDVDLFLVIARDVNPKILEYLQSSSKAAADYNRLEANREEVQATFILMYGLIAFVILFAAIWLGLAVRFHKFVALALQLGGHTVERLAQGRKLVVVARQHHACGEIAL